jgi:hypothetical protein
MNGNRYTNAYQEDQKLDEKNYIKEDFSIIKITIGQNSSRTELNGRK